MRYEIIPDKYLFVTVCNDIPNNSYVYSNTLNSNQMSIIKRQEGQYIQLNMSNKINTANTTFNILLNRNPNDEVYVVDQTTKTGTCTVNEYKLDMNNCPINLQLNANYSLRITNPIHFLNHYVDYEISAFLNSISNKTENAFQRLLNETMMNGYELITNGYQLNELTNKIQCEINHSCSFYGIIVTIQHLTLKVSNFNEISEFYNHEMKYARQTKEKIIDRLIDTIFDQYSNTETISANQTRILETYLNNAIIENTQLNIEEVTEKFSKMSRTFTFKDLIENLDQVNKRLNHIHYLENK